MDGIQAARQIRDRYSLPVVFLTSYTDDETIARAGQIEPLGYISKPFSDRELHSTIQIALYRHAAELALRVQREWLDSLLRSLGDAVVATDEFGCIRLLNRVAERLTGWSEATAKGRPFFEVVQLMELSTRRPVDPVNEALRSGRIRQGDRFVLVSRNGTECTVEDSTSLIPSSDFPTGCAFVFRDITARLSAEQALLHSQRMESLGRLAGGVAHEFNNLLTVIVGRGSEGLEASSSDPDNAVRYSEILAAADHGADVARKLLALGGRQISERKPLNANDFVRGLAHSMQGALTESISLIIEADAGSPMVLADRGQLEQAMLNLFLNARDSIQGTGKITFRTDNVHPPGPPVGPASSWVRITVTDTGVGIPPELQSQVFEPFFTTREPSMGAGLGLSTVYGIVAQSGGRMDVSSTVGTGSTFSVYLPVWVEQRAEVPVAPPPAASHLVSTVLLVDDDALVRRLEAAILDGGGFDIRQASGGAEALQLFTEAPADFDVLVTDVLMPGISGIDLARRLRIVRPDLPVLFVSGFSGDFVNMDEFAPHLTAFLQKPFNPAVLQKAVSDLLKSSGS